ncbi:hypothetical protein [Prosthecobacter sp.]|uniref:hypothetical protein n=1 Tax=Prosthecobacter sp. TaxID=1965333 RepID=UPI00378494F5
MSDAAESSQFVFKRTWSYRWIGAPVCLWAAVWIFSNMVQDGLKDWRFGALFVAGCLCVVLGLWLPSRLAVWPLRVLGGMISVVMVFSFMDTWERRAQVPGFGGWHGVYEILRASKGVFLLTFPGMWFALTGKIGWREDQRPVIV